MAKVTLAQITKSPLDYLYIFAPDSFLKQLGNKVGGIIRSKRTNQVHLLNRIAVDNGSTYEAYRDAISSAIQDQYGMSPAKILVALAEGKNVAGKNWSKGVYGVGATNTLTKTYATDGSVTVDTAGKIMLTSSGKLVEAQTPIYENDTLVGYAATHNGSIYTSVLGADGNFYANTVGTATYQKFADGSEYDGSKARSVWESILTYAPYCIQLIQWILSLIPGVNNRTIITPQNTIPSQSEFTYNSGVSSNELILLLVGGVALYGLTK